jgi:NADH:ubiquinone oxidoreductase subunit 2 (subunit N)
MILSFLFFTLTSVIDILTFILIIETTSLIITILGAKSLKTFKYHNLKPIEGSLRFFVFNALNTGFVLVGVGLLY